MNNCDIPDHFNTIFRFKTLNHDRHPQTPSVANTASQDAPNLRCLCDESIEHLPQLRVVEAQGVQCLQDATPRVLRRRHLTLQVGDLGGSG